MIRAVRKTTTLERIDPTTTPKQIDLTTDAPAGVVFLDAEGKKYKPTGKINHGIYELAGGNLRYFRWRPNPLTPPIAGDNRALRGTSAVLGERGREPSGGVTNSPTPAVRPKIRLAR